MENPGNMQATRSIQTTLFILCTVSQPDTMPYWETVIDFKWQKQGYYGWEDLGLPEDGACTDLFENPAHETA